MVQSGATEGWIPPSLWVNKSLQRSLATEREGLYGMCTVAESLKKSNRRWELDQKLQQHGGRVKTF